MARRRRRPGFGGTPIQHVRSLRQALHQQHVSATAAIARAEEGACSRAFSAYEDATYWRGQAVAHGQGTTRRSLPRGTLEPLRQLNRARRAVERLCIVKGRA